MLVLNLPEDIDRRLEALAEQTGRTKAFYVREAIEMHLDNLEDIDLAEERLKGARAADTISLATLKIELGLND